MDIEEIRRSAERVIEKADKIQALTKKDGWAEFMEVLEILLQQELRALSGQSLDHSYYKKIGFIQETAFIKAIPNIVKDRNVLEYLLHQGRAKSIETAKGIPAIFQKQKRAALDQLRQIFGNGQSMEEARKEVIEETYKKS